MDKQKQIEEIARTTCNYNAKNFESCVECTKGGLLSCDRLVQAEKLYNAGYRKIPENAVVLTGDEYERWQGQTLNLKKVRKETAEKFAERLKALYVPRLNEWDEISVGGLCFEIDEICKEITEGKE